jgi:hypothetical protein
MPSIYIQEVMRFIQQHALKATLHANHEQNAGARPSARRNRKRRSRTDNVIVFLTGVLVALAVAILVGLALILLVWGACTIMLPQLIG